MRGTSKITNNNSLMYLNRNYQSLSKVTGQIAMQQQVVDLQDDPLSATLGLKMLNVIARSEQYNRNIKSGYDTLLFTEGYISSIKNSLDSLNDKVIDGASDSKSQSARKALAIEVNEILKSIVAGANAFDGTRYVFGGQHTTTPPYTIVGGRYVNYLGNNKNVNINVDNNSTAAINTNGSDVFGNMTTTIPSRDMNPDVNLSTDHSTRLSDLNGGDGVPKGKIKVYYSAYPEGLEVDLSGCDTLEDVKDTIEKATLEASRNLDPNQHSWLDGSNLDWHDMQDRYVKVTVNPDKNGISLQEFDLGEPLPEPTAQELKKGLTYSGKPGYGGGGDTGIASQDMDATGEVTVYDKIDYINHSQGGVYHARLRVDDVAQNKVAEALGIKGTANAYNANKPDAVKDGFIHGRDINPILSDRTLLADLEGYNDSVYTITNGSKPGQTVITETTQDPNNVFNDWNLSGLALGKNTGKNGELYARAVNRGTAADPDIVVEIYTCPIDKATSADLVATGTYTQSGSGGTVILQEVNSSGVSGSVGIILPDTVKEFSVDLSVDFGDNFTGSIHVPAFIEEQDAYGRNKDVLNIASGWNIKGLDKPPADGYDINHPASTDLNGDISVNYRYDAANNRFIVELCRPAYGDQPAKIIASGSMYLGDNNTPPLDSPVSGRIEFDGAPGFEGISGSVYIELPAGTSFTGVGKTVGSDITDPTAGDYTLPYDAPKGDFVLGGDMELRQDLQVDDAFALVPGTVFKRGQVFDVDVTLSDGSILPAGQPLMADDAVTGPNPIKVRDSIKAGTVLLGGQALTNAGPIASGTIIPGGSYYTDGQGGFPALATTTGTSAGDPTGQTYKLDQDAPAGDIVIGDNMKLIQDQAVVSPFTLAGDTTFKKGQVFTSPIALPDGTVIPAGTPLDKDTVIPAGTTVDVDGGIIKAGTVLRKGQALTATAPIPAGTTIPAGSYYTDGVGSFALPGSRVGTSADDATTNTYQLTSDAPKGDFILGGATELIKDLAVDDPFTLTADTVFKKGQVFDIDIPLPGGGFIKAGVPLERDTRVAKGVTVKVQDSIKEGTVLPAGQKLTNAGPLAAGTVIPRGSYYTDGAGGFPAAGMGISVAQVNPYTGVQEVNQTPTTGGFDLRATFATIEDFNRAVEEAGIYVRAEVSSDGKSLQFTSTLAGAWLTVSEDTDCYEQMGDVNQQLTGLDFNGLVKGVNSDKNGNVYTEVVYYPPDPITGGSHKLVSKDGTVTEIEPGYYVRVYSDPDQMLLNWEDRDNTKMVAEGFVPAGQWNPDWDETNPSAHDPFIIDPDNTGLYELGFMKNLVLEERNNSGLSGRVDLDYYGGRGQFETTTVTNPDGSTTTTTNFDPHKNDNITVFPGGLRPAGSEHTTIQEWDIYKITPGITCDYSGTFHGEITRNQASAAGNEIRLYRDGSHSLMTARNDPDEAPVDGKITLYEVDKYGNFTLDANGQRTVIGTMAVPDDKNRLPDGETDSFTLTTGGNRNYGQEREENVFSTINDVLDALNHNDASALHDLLGNVSRDVARVTEAYGEVGARMKRLTTLSNRHADDILNFNATLTSRVGMDDQALAKAVMNYKTSTEAFQAAMQVSAQVMQLSLLHYL